MPREELRQKIREAGLRLTASREAVLALVQEGDGPMTHAEVSEALADSSWDRATLYRNLNDLSDAGLLRRVSLGSTWHFEAAAEGRHAHFVCTECGSVECAPDLEVPAKRGTKLPRSLRRGDVEVQLHGVCDDCD